MSEVLAQVRSLLAEAENLANAGQLTAAEVKCQDASQRIMQLSQLSRDRPELSVEAERLFARLKATVDRIKKIKKTKKPAASPELEENALFDDNPFSERNLMAQAYRDQQRLDLTKARERDMDKLAQDMIDLEEIFRKVNELVAEQAEQVNLIEDQVNAAEEQAIEGQKQLGDAVVSKRSSRKKKIIIICVVIAALLVLGLILYLVLSKVL